jgi:16S rRNA (cytosine967-C5)-methyltransferase
LLDAPCSATGTIRRHPDLPQARDGSEMPGLIELQARMIDHALALLRPGGRLVFATCSLLPEEGEEQAAAALARHPGLVAERPEAEGAPEAWLTDLGLRTRPDHWAELGGLDGFFVSRLRKPPT